MVKNKCPIPTKKTNAFENKQDHTPELFQCPCCGLAGRQEIFRPFWQEELYQLVAKSPGHGIDDTLIASLSYHDQYGTFLYLNRISNDGE